MAYLMSICRGEQERERNGKESKTIIFGARGKSSKKIRKSRNEAW